MHYPDGQEVLLGDHVRGRTYNQRKDDGERSGVVTSTHFMDGVMTCNVYVSFLTTHRPWTDSGPVPTVMGDYTDPSKLELVRRG